MQHPSSLICARFNSFYLFVWPPRRVHQGELRHLPQYVNRLYVELPAHVPFDHRDGSGGNRLGLVQFSHEDREAGDRTRGVEGQAVAL
jgi:hypothetical protein